MCRINTPLVAAMEQSLCGAALEASSGPGSLWDLHRKSAQSGCPRVLGMLRLPARASTAGETGRCRSGPGGLAGHFDRLQLLGRLLIRPALRQLASLVHSVRISGQCEARQSGSRPPGVPCVRHLSPDRTARIGGRIGRQRRGTDVVARQKDAEASAVWAYQSLRCQARGWVGSTELNPK